MRLWRGEYSLPVAFWAFWVLGYFVLRIPLFLALIWLARSFPSLRSFPAVFGQCLELAYLILTSVGVWRSATAYKPTAKLTVGFTTLDWGLLAKVAVIIWDLRYAYIVTARWAGRLAGSA
jgi:hypothetical protein